MLKKLSKEQEEAMSVVRDEWMRAFNSCPDLIDEEFVRGEIEWVYSLAKLKKPEVIIADSPYSAQVIVNRRAGNKKMSYYSVGWRMSTWDWGWTAFYDYFDRIGIDLKCEHWARWRKFVRFGAIFSTIQLDGLCVVSRMPLFIKRDDESNNPRLHSINGPAIRFRDGFEIYSLWGVRFPRDLYLKVVSRKIDAKDVLQLENIEQRMAALRFLGAEEVLKAFDSKVVDEKDGYTLLSVDGLTDETEYALKYPCPSTAREYVSFVRPEIGKKKDAILAIASKWGLSKEQWYQIGAHS